MNKPEATSRYADCYSSIGNRKSYSTERYRFTGAFLSSSHDLRLVRAKGTGIKGIRSHQFRDYPQNEALCRT